METNGSVQFMKHLFLSNHNYVFTFRLLIETVLKYTRFISPTRNPTLKLKSPKYYTTYLKIVKYMKIHFIVEGHLKSSSKILEMRRSQVCGNLSPGFWKFVICTGSRQQRDKCPNFPWRILALWVLMDVKIQKIYFESIRFFILTLFIQTCTLQSP